MYSTEPANVGLYVKAKIKTQINYILILYSFQ
jgi:hypothetical protein